LHRVEAVPDEDFIGLNQEASGALKRMTLDTYQTANPARITFETGFSHSETRSYWLCSRYPALASRSVHRAVPRELHRRKVEIGMQFTPAGTEMSERMAGISQPRNSAMI
jgi:hypothetical protein